MPFYHPKEKETQKKIKRKLKENIKSKK